MLDKSITTDDIVHCHEEVKIEALNLKKANIN